MLLEIKKLLILKSVPIFAEAPDHVLAQVVPILEEQEFEAGQHIFEKGDLGTSMYVTFMKTAMEYSGSVPTGAG